MLSLSAFNSGLFLYAFSKAAFKVSAKTDSVKKVTIKKILKKYSHLFLYTADLI